MPIADRRDRGTVGPSRTTVMILSRLYLPRSDIGRGMIEPLPPCPECRSTYTYEGETLLNCPECGHEWPLTGPVEGRTEVRDSVGNLLADGDTVTVIKDLKLKGSSGVIKVGTKVRSIRLVDGDHDIDCRIPGIGAIGLKSQFVKKVTD